MAVIQLVEACAASNSVGPVLLSQAGLQVLPRMLHLKRANLRFRKRLATARTARLLALSQASQRWLVVARQRSPDMKISTMQRLTLPSRNKLTCNEP